LRENIIQRRQMRRRFLKIPPRARSTLTQVIFLPNGKGRDRSNQVISTSCGATDGSSRQTGVNLFFLFFAG